MIGPMATGAANKITQVQTPPKGARMVGTYQNAAGYIRRRWQTGPRQYAEMYEHRHVAGTPAGQQADHKNRDKADNSRSNLANMTPSRHAAVGNLRRKMAGARSK